VVSKALVSIKNDLVPMLLECQHRKTLVESLGISGFQQDHQPDLFKKARLYSLSQPNVLPQVSCYAIVQRQGFTARANTVWSYAEINRTMVKNLPNEKVPDTTEVSPKTQVLVFVNFKIGNDSLIGHSTTIGERCSVKRTVVGNHVKIGKGCKLINCVVMDYVVLEDG
jgi:translation initiation factor eIF-2B subunit gamma